MRGREASKPARKIRYAVVGLGYISQIAVLPAFAQLLCDCQANRRARPYNGRENAAHLPPRHQTLPHFSQ